MENLRTKITHTFLLPEKTKKDLLSADIEGKSGDNISEFFSRYSHIEEEILWHIDAEIRKLTSIIQNHIEKKEWTRELAEAKNELDTIMV